MIFGNPLMMAGGERKEGLHFLGLYESTGQSHAVDLGAPQSDRTIVVGAFMAGSSGQITGFNVGGSAVTVLAPVSNNSSGTADGRFGALAVPSGSSATVEIVGGTGVSGTALAVWAVYGGLTPSYNDWAVDESPTSRTTATASALNTLKPRFSVAMAFRDTIGFSASAGTKNGEIALSYSANRYFACASALEGSAVTSVSAGIPTSDVLLLYVGQFE